MTKDARAYFKYFLLNDENLICTTMLILISIHPNFQWYSIDFCRSLRVTMTQARHALILLLAFIITRSFILAKNYTLRKTTCCAIALWV